MSVRLCRFFLTSAIVLSALHLAAQSCPTGYWPIVKFSGTNCIYGAYPQQPCTLSAPVTFTLADYNSGAPYTLQSCETGVTWAFGDGTTGSGVTVQHTYSAAGYYNVQASIASTSYPRSSSTSVTLASGVISMSPAKSSYSENEGSAAMNVHTTYSPASVNYTIYDYSGAAGRFTPATGTVSFAAGETDKTISIPLIDDSIFEGTGAIAVQLSGATGGVLFKDSYGYTTSNSIFSTITLLDNDPPPTLNFSAPKYTFSEAAGNAVLTVNRTGDLTRAVSVYYYVSGAGYQYGTLIFNTNETSKTITVPIPNDNVWTPNRTWTVELQSPSNGAVLVSPTSNIYYLDAPVVITDDEPTPSVSISDASVTEGNTGHATATLNISLSAPLTTSCTVNLTYGGTATRTVDYDAPSTSVFFNAGETSKTIPFTINGDTQIEPNETVTVTVASVSNFFYPTTPNVPAIAKGTGTLTILNDDIGMPWVKLAAGTSGRMSIYLGNPTAAQDTVILSSSKPDVAKVPASFVAQSGRSTLDFDVQALTPGSSLITATFPASLGGAKLSAYVDVYTPATLTMQPPSLSIPVNTTGTVTLTMSPAPAAPVDVKVSASSTTLIQAPATVTIGTNGNATLTVKGLVAGNCALTLTLPDENGGFGTTVAVTVTAPPTGVFVTQVAPPNGPTAGGTATTITGLNFAAPCTVTFGGNASPDATFVSATSLKATTPAHGAGAVDVVVTCGTDRYTFANGFTYVANTPRISAVSPVSGNTRGGTVVVVTGSDLRSGCGVLFGGALARIINDLSPDKLVVTVPPHDPGPVDVGLQCGDASVSLTSAFVYVSTDEPSAVIGDVDPLVASPGQSVTLNGIRFRPSDAIMFGEAHATVISTLPTSHVAIVPALSPGRVSVTLTDSDGHTSTTGPIFTVLEAVTPEITSVTPTRAAQGGEIVITGKGFRSPYTFALDGKSAGKIVDLAFDRAVVRLDASFAAGSYTLGVLNSSGNLAAIGPKIDIVQALAASAVAPMCATANGGIDVTIKGSGFQAGARVTFGASAATNVRVVDDHTIIATVPPGHISWPTISVTNSNGDSATLTRAFFYYSPFDPEGGCAFTKTRGVRH